MTKTTLTILSFLFFGICFSQKEITGKIISGDLILKNIEVVNFNTKKTAITNDFGEFKISAKENDELIILTDKYFNKTIVVSKRMLTEKSVINLSEKPIELDEVEVAKTQKINITPSYNDIAMTKIAKEAAAPKNDAVYTGVTTNGVDFVQIGKMIGKLFKKKKQINEVPKYTLDFKEYSKNNFSNDFYTKTLEIKPDQVALFIDFCEADPKSKEIVKSEDEFTILDFLISKKSEFLKVQSQNKK